MKRTDVRKLAIHNPKVDLTVLKESMRLAEELRRAGVARRPSIIVSPLNRKRVVTIQLDGCTGIACLQHAPQPTHKS